VSIVAAPKQHHAELLEILRSAGAKERNRLA
jgi:hypothetical protein